MYIGVTNDLARRLFEHKNKLIPGFSAKYNTTRLMFYQEFDTIEQAIEMEKVIKKWNRKKKLNLIKTINPTYCDLAVDHFNLEISRLYIRDDRRI